MLIWSNGSADNIRQQSICQDDAGLDKSKLQCRACSDFLQEYAKKYGDVAYFALKGMRVVVMDTVASYEDKKTSEVKAAIVARNVYNVVACKYQWTKNLCFGHL